ncbi:MAG: glutamate--tRNA ligase [Candidatus Buchananbacteria bacterium RIFCSPHIGHO2_02_FULL_56_16]|uniref:Glutamate--tRNA ligase n=1 Tax=Candidatus Buchananbacteria bacterium RIFCSPHIGHO2_02_FULL_56_16 TaxID=1797542 RepID=A0A1G1YGR3_9BACT|nr:MAG: glutamate--tRNA ligase [Candidatus Buchananbacteria bacterium RIFCSPHIGHO2_02_FULL_56_16]
MPKKIVTRFSPSPTGFLHVGGLRTALYNYLFAQRNKGQFLLRIEDTDQSRRVEGAVENIIETLEAFGLKPDNKKPVVQSERLKTYRQYAEQLIKDGQAYYCFCTPQRLEQLRQGQQTKKLPPRYDGRCRDYSSDEVEKNLATNQPRVIRFKTPKTGQTTFADAVRGAVSFDHQTLDDQIILKSDGYPTYHLASVIDDHEMDISHVIRGEEWLPSTPKHLLLYAAFGWPPPQYAHLPLLLNPDRSKLSKRQGDVAVEDYLKKGYLPEALLNFILLLGWNPGTEQEIFSLKEMVQVFKLEQVNKAGAVFDTKKLDWLNGHYIRQKSPAELTSLCQPYFTAAGITADKKFLEKVVATEQQRIRTLAEIVEATRFFFEQPKYEAELLIWKRMTGREAMANLKRLADELQTIEEKKWTADYLEQHIQAFIQASGARVGEMLWPMRAALSGRPASPGPFEIAGVLGKKETLKRIEHAMQLLDGHN